MKLSRTSWLILTAGVFVVAFASLGIAHAQQLQEQARLDDNLAIAQRRLTKLELRQLTLQKMETEKQLAQIRSQLETVQDKMRHPISSIQETDTIFNIAEACQVTVTDISSSDMSSDQLGNINCSVLTLTVRVNGEVTDLINFIIKLNNGFTTGTVKSADIDIPQEAEESASANIRMVVYSHPEG